jgi:hypothetical protein
VSQDRIESLRLGSGPEEDRRLAVVRLQGGAKMEPVSVLETAGRISQALRHMGVTDVTFEVVPAETA